MAKGYVKKSGLNIKAENDSIAVGEINVGGDVSGSIHVGNVGYSSEQVSVLLKQITSTFQAKPFDGRCPYKGLDVFEEEDAETFFGREKIVDDLLKRVEESRSLFITGPSGSGKSSLARAGLIYQLKGRHGDRWLFGTMKPGREPLHALANVISGFAKTTNAAKEIRENGMTDATILSQWCDIALGEGRDKRAVVFIDQFEEIFTQANETERVAFLDLIAHAATVEGGRAVVLFSMRSDFVSNCAVYPQVNALVNQQFVQIGSMQADELVSAIAQPALRVGLKIDPDLIAQIINDMQGEPGALPLMQFALKDLFDSGQAKGGLIALTLSDYLARGGIRKSLERHADSAFAKLTESEQALARSVFGGLIEIGRGTQDTKRTALFNELIPSNATQAEAQAVIQKLADARLITTDEQDEMDTVTIAHEKLIDAWPWLKKLVNENRDAIALRNEIATDAKEWEDRQRDASYLYTGARLANAREQLDNKKLELSGAALEFVKTARARQRRNQVALIASVATAFILMAIAVVVFAALTNKAQKQATIALSRQLTSQAQSLYASDPYSTIAPLLLVESNRRFPSIEAIQILQAHLNYLPAKLVSSMEHVDRVRAVAFSPDGKWVVSGGGDGTARVWEAETGKEIARMEHDGWVNAVAFSPDGKWVVSGGGDGTARVWEAETGKEIARMKYTYEVYAVAFSPDSKWVVSGSADGTARVWEAQTGKEIAHMEHDDKVLAVAFSPDGKWVVSSGCDLYDSNKGCTKGSARVWEAGTGKEIAHMEYGGGVYAVAFSPDGKWVVSGGCGLYASNKCVKGSARVWEAATGREIARMEHDDWVTAVAFSPDSNWVVSGSEDGTVRVWEAGTGKGVARMENGWGVSAVAFSPDGKWVFSGSQDGTARVWEAQTGEDIERMEHDGKVFAVAFSPDGKWVVSGSADGTARVWEAETGKEIVHMEYDGNVYAVAFSPDGKWVVSGGCDLNDRFCTKGSARVWEAGTGKEIARMEHGGDIWDVAFSPDGKWVVTGGCDLNDAYDCTKGSARVWEAGTGKEIARMEHDGKVFAVAFSPDGKWVVSGSADGTARVWEAQTGKEIARMEHDGWVNAVAFSPDGKWVVSGSADGTARVWEAQTGKEIARMEHDSIVYAVAFSPDGKSVVSGSEDHTARVWKTETGKEIAHMEHDSIVYAVAFSPDGKWVVSGSQDGTARVWEAQTGKEIARMEHDVGVNAVAFSSDGKWVVSGGEDGTVRVWIWQIIQHACERLPRNLTRAEWAQYFGDEPYHATCPNLPEE